MQSPATKGRCLICSISGASFSPNSTVNRRQLLSALVKAGEVRGRDAAGYAFVAGDKTGMYKKNVPGSQLYVGNLPEDAESFIAHTRASTHGSPKDMSNNHPIESPGGTIRLVHNGVISNHEQVRTVLGSVGELLPEVDSSVIPAVIETFGLESTDVIRGDATAAWFDSETGATLHLAKFQHNPISYAWLADGTFVFASTTGILGTALSSLGLRWFGTYPKVFEEFEEADYLQILGGDIIHDGEVEWDRTRQYGYGANNWRAVTSGATTMGTATTGATPTTSTPVAALDKGRKVDEENRRTALVETPAGVATSDDPEEDIWPYGDTLGADAYDFWVANGRLPDEDDDIPEVLLNSAEKYAFYTIEDDGTYTQFSSLAAMCANLSWYSDLSDPANPIVGPEDGKLRWVNHFTEIGNLNNEGLRVSWIDDDDAMDKFRGSIPSFVPNGVDKLRLLVKAAN